MRLQLDSSVSSVNDPQQTSAAGATGSARSLGTPGEKGQDRIQISGAANLLAASAADHSARVGQLKAAVQSGSYQPSSTAISQAIVSQALP